MAVSSGTNISSQTESSLNLIFPARDDIRTKIPLWMKFYCFEYSTSAYGRIAVSNDVQGGGNLNPIPGFTTVQKAAIFIPAPTSFETLTSNTYIASPTSASSLLPGYAGDLLTVATPEIGILQIIADLFGSALESGYGYFTGKNSVIETDLFDNQYKSSGPSRTFEIRFQMPCITVEDSMVAGEVVRSFEALSLPSARSLFSLASTKTFHPPVWCFGIGPLDQRKYDKDWTGQPQLSVLRAVKFRQTAFDTNSIAAIGYPGKKLLKPIAYTVTLSFAELEPAYRLTSAFNQTGTKIGNRSTVIFTQGNVSGAGTTSPTITQG